MKNILRIIIRELKLKLGWKVSSVAVEHFDQFGEVVSVQFVLPKPERQFYTRESFGGFTDEVELSGDDRIRTTA